jgi:hypothetical protein
VLCLETGKIMQRLWKWKRKLCNSVFENGYNINVMALYLPHCAKFKALMAWLEKQMALLNVFKNSIHVLIPQSFP